MSHGGCELVYCHVHQRRLHTNLRVGAAHCKENEVMKISQAVKPRMGLAGYGLDQ